MLRKSKHIFFSSSLRKALSFSFILLFLTGYFQFFIAPQDFPTQKIITIERGMNLEDIAGYLKEEGVIRSPFLFSATVRLLGGEKNAHAGDYYLNHTEGVFVIASRIVSGKFGLNPVVVQIPEGLTVEEIAKRLGNTLDTFDTERFISLAKADEGYLFPDTYYLLPTVTEREVLRIMRETFDTRIEEVEGDIRASGKSLKDIVIMASLLEREASDFETKQRISGVLWNRINAGMPLQVDAVFVYLFQKGTKELSTEDLKFDSPYNTYLYKGLPPGPIANSGLESLKAALAPATTSDFYYLADKNGVTHFSETFEEHKEKKALYLN